MENKKQKGIVAKIKKTVSVIGPGVVTGAADDDPSGIVTYTQAGAQFGFGQLWTILLTLPLMVSVQEICGRIGIVTGKGLAENIKEHYSRKVLLFLVFLLLIANTINLGADIGAMAAAAQLFVNLPFVVLAAIFFVIILALEIFLPYHRYAKILKWLAFSLCAYLITGIIVTGNWGQVLAATFIPSLNFTNPYLLMIVAVVGTTISPYLFFWQASQEVEEREDWFMQNHKMPRVTKKYIANMRLDTFMGMIFSNITAWFIIVTAASVFHANGITDINSADQAASALTPLVQSFPYAGTIAHLLFGLGIIGTGLLAIPIFAASSSYAVAEVFSWKEGLSYKFSQARAFYGTIIAGTLIGFLINFIGVNPIKALVYTAVINGIIAVPMIVMLIHISNDKKIMGKYTSGFWSNLFATLTFVGMTLAALFMLYTFFA
jgi:NRAMP (natural resistance-associated macrophage protein)-like metal ion transporter